MCHKTSICVESGIELTAASWTAQHEYCMLSLKREVDRRDEEAFLLVAGFRDNARGPIETNLFIRLDATCEQ